MEPNSTPSPDTQSGGLPEKYIRTFASDMSVVEKGSVPGLAPLKEPSPAPSAFVMAPTPTVSTSEPMSTVPSKEPVQSTPIKTYSQDFRERMRETSASTASIIAAEQDAMRPISTVPEEPIQNSRNLWYVSAGVLLLVAGGIGVYIAYSRYITAVTPVEVAPVAATPIFVDSRESISGTGAMLQKAIAQSAAKPLMLNTVRLLSYDQALGMSVLEAFGTRAPGSLIRNIDAARSMVGIVSIGSGQSPFFILSVGSYGASFSGMLAWEPTIQADLATIYPLSLVPTATVAAAATTTTATTTTARAAPVRQGGFRDEVVSNHDVRVYRDASGKSILIYGYWNQATLVIARDPNAFAEILGRLATSHS